MDTVGTHWVSMGSHSNIPVHNWYIDLWLSVEFILDSRVYLCPADCLPIQFAVEFADFALSSSVVFKGTIPREYSNLRFICSFPLMNRNYETFPYQSQDRLKVCIEVTQ